MNTYLNESKSLFELHSNTENAEKMAQYMRHQFEFYGIKAPLRKELLKELEQKQGRLKGSDLMEFVQAAWEEPQRELQYLAMDRMDKVKRQLNLDFLSILEYCIVHKSWWDSVDWLAINGIGTILKKHPKYIQKYNEKWISSDNIWLNRTAILFQLKYKDQTNIDLLFFNILAVANSKEFFLQKAAGWALRQLSKSNPLLVNDFIQNHILPPLTVREGSKYLI